MCMIFGYLVQVDENLSVHDFSVACMIDWDLRILSVSFESSAPFACAIKICQKQRAYLGSDKCIAWTQKNLKPCSGKKKNQIATRIMSASKKKTALTIDAEIPSLATLSSDSFSTPTSQQKRSSPGSAKERAIKYILSLGLDGFTFDALDDKGKSRAMKLMGTSDYHWSPGKEQDSPCHTPTTFRTVFGEFQKKHTEANHPFFTEDANSSVFKVDDNTLHRVFFDESAMERYLVIRQQQSSICYMHAGALLQHYLKCTRSDNLEDHTMLDLTSYIRDKMKPEEVRKYIETGGGGQSVSFFRDITQIGIKGISQVHCEAGNYDDVEDIMVYWKRYKGPALVSEFSIEKNFFTSKNSSFDYEVDDKEFLDYAASKGKPLGSMGLHSMVLIGIHKDETTNKVWFLLQNSWKGNFLCLVSDKYLISCRPTITFIKGTQDVSLKDDLTTVEGVFFEADFDYDESDQCDLSEDDEDCDVIVEV